MASPPTMAPIFDLEPRLGDPPPAIVLAASPAQAGCAKMLLPWCECAWLYENDRVCAAEAYLPLALDSSSRSPLDSTGVDDGTTAEEDTGMTMGGGGDRAVGVDGIVEEGVVGDRGMGARRGGGRGVGVLLLNASSHAECFLEGAANVVDDAMDGTMASSLELAPRPVVDNLVKEGLWGLEKKRSFFDGGGEDKAVSWASETAAELGIEAMAEKGKEEVNGEGMGERGADEEEEGEKEAES